MKKVMYGTLFLALVGIGFSSCEKEELRQNIKNENSEKLPSKDETYSNDYDFSKLSVKNDVLVFESIEYYQSLVDNKMPMAIDYLIDHIKKMNFRSFSGTTIDREESDYDDDFLLSMLDVNQIVKIGEWYLRLNFESNKVFACSDQDSEAYNLVLNEETTEENVYEFSVNDDVLRILNDGDLQLWAWGCSDRKANKKKSSSSQISLGTINSIPMVMRLNLKYLKAGFYFTLKAEGSCTTEYPAPGDVARLRYWFQLQLCEYEVRCGHSETNYSHPWKNPTHTINGQHTTTPQFKWYSGSTNLKEFYYKVRLRCEDSAIPAGNNPYTTYFTNYVTIQDF